MSQQHKPPSGFNAFMDKAGWSTVAIAVGTAIASIATLWAGMLHILNFDWIIFLLALIMVAVTIYFVWYSIRTRIILQEQYQQDIASIRKELRKFQDDLTQRVNQEINRWNEWAINFSQTNAKEQEAWTTLTMCYTRRAKRKTEGGGWRWSCRCEALEQMKSRWSQVAAWRGGLRYARQRSLLS